MPALRRTPPRNPFVIGHHAEGAGFCDLRSEVGRIARALRDPGARLLLARVSHGTGASYVFDDPFFREWVRANPASE